MISKKDEKKLILRFLRNPVEFIPSESDPSKLGMVKMQRMQLEGGPNKQRAVNSEAEDDLVLSHLKCDAFIKSVGYKSERIPGLPWDDKKHVIPHSYGCIEDPKTEQLLIGLYCAGWVKRGPVGIIDATLRDSLETFK